MREEEAKGRENHKLHRPAAGWVFMGGGVGDHHSNFAEHVCVCVCVCVGVCVWHRVLVNDDELARLDIAHVLGLEI